MLLTACECENADCKLKSSGVLQLVNEALNAVLKRIIKEPRPVLLIRHHLSTYGMPSDHSQFMFFAATYVALFAALRWGQPAIWRAVWIGVAFAFAAVVAWTRVYLMYHTPAQVLVGAVLGSLLGAAWFAITELALKPWFPVITAHPLARWLLVRDCSGCPDLLEAEYAVTHRPGSLTGASLLTPDGRGSAKLA